MRASARAFVRKRRGQWAPSKIFQRPIEMSPGASDCIAFDSIAFHDLVDDATILIENPYHTSLI